MRAVSQPSNQSSRLLGCVARPCVCLLASGFAAAGRRADDPQSKASKPTHEVKIEFDRRIPMRDGVTLSADVYRPDAEGRFPVILSRTPYLKSPARQGGPGALPLLRRQGLRLRRRRRPRPWRFGRHVRALPRRGPRRL